ncbi:RNA polymerase sigma factor [Chitinophaga japonensis]|uniref:RNA polymerase sigma-70 factor (ECF subfamily) n=1 Tax=Chitinophaga japonensis TaxID=104662 RepID=A0A562T7N1_CHIJA|nr:sigma-70 family RNA polymerase sigma factor [Chitinophaga japonensis]TWI89218.1 RNA polymerase sigma-70 factor (ECF subfamily) [Chitinophaga japonensis]
MRYQQSTEAELLQLLAGNDSAAFEALYHRYWQQLYIFAFKKLRQADEAKDAVQDVFINLWQRRHHLQVHTTLQAYLYAAVRYEILRRYAAALKAGVSPAQVEQLVLAAPAQATDAVHEKELLQQLHTAVEQLPLKMKEIYLLSRNNHKPIAVIADELSLSEQTVKNQLSRALMRLRAHLKETAL